MEFEGRVALVTGGSRGIGKAIVTQLSERGARVYFTFRNWTDELRQLEEAGGGFLRPVQCDVSNYDAVKDMIKGIYSENEKIDFVVCNAGITRDKPLALMSVEDWRAVIDTNLNGTFHVCKSVVIKMMKQKSGRIINISSTSGLVGNPTQCNYAASKAAIIGFSKSLAKEVAGYGIRVNVIAPGVVETDMVASLEKYRDQILNAIPLHRYGRADEIAALASYLLSDAADYITGEVIKVDGGMFI